jgi:hypothetical protein
MLDFRSLTLGEHCINTSTYILLWLYTKFLIKIFLNCPEICHSLQSVRFKPVSQRVICRGFAVPSWLWRVLFRISLWSHEQRAETSTATHTRLCKYFDVANQPCNHLPTDSLTCQSSSILLPLTPIAYTWRPTYAHIHQYIPYSVYATKHRHASKTAELYSAIYLYCDIYVFCKQRLGKHCLKTGIATNKRKSTTSNKNGFWNCSTVFYMGTPVFI